MGEKFLFFSHGGKVRCSYTKTYKRTGTGFLYPSLLVGAVIGSIQTKKLKAKPPSPLDSNIAKPYHLQYTASGDIPPMYASPVQNNELTQYTVKKVSGFPVPLSRCPPAGDGKTADLFYCVLG